MPVSNLGYFGLTSTDPERWCRFATDVLGMMRSGDDTTLRVDGYSWRIAVEVGERDDIAFAGFEVPGKHELEALVTHMRSMGFAIDKCDTAHAAKRCVAELYQCVDPGGLQVELYYGALQRAEVPFRSPQGVCFVTDDQGLGHLVISAIDGEACRRFWSEGLGFRLSDTMALRAGDNVIDVEFYHCNARHHTLALVPLDNPSRLHHFMLEVSELDQVGFARDRLDQAENASIARDIGRHSNDKVISFYARMPGGTMVEYGHGGVLVDESTWRVMRYEKASDWGHRGPSTLVKPEA